MVKLKEFFKNSFAIIHYYFYAVLINFSKELEVVCKMAQIMWNIISALRSCYDRILYWPFSILIVLHTNHGRNHYVNDFKSFPIYIFYLK